MVCEEEQQFYTQTPLCEFVYPLFLPYVRLTVEPWGAVLPVCKGETDGGVGRIVAEGSECPRQQQIINK